MIRSPYSANECYLAVIPTCWLIFNRLFGRESPCAMEVRLLFRLWMCLASSPEHVVMDVGSRL